VVLKSVLSCRKRNPASGRLRPAPAFGGSSDGETETLVRALRDRPEQKPYGKG